MKYYDIVLATASPRRRELIKKIECVRPVFMPVDAHEIIAENAEQTAAANAALKGRLAMSMTELPVLAFDTVVGLNGEVFGKPRDAEDAKRMFRALCGNTHEVITAVFLGNRSKIIEKQEKTYVTFGAFDEDLVYNYIASGAPFDKAGGYNIDDPAIAPLVIGLRGDYDNVVGLPVKLTEKLIEENL